MRISIAAAIAALATSLLTVAPVASAVAAPAAAPPVTQGVTALYEMNEPAGTTVMTDSSGNGNNGVVNPAGVTSGVSYQGATGYEWPFRLPTEPPASPERVIQVPDSAAIEPVNDAFTIEIRFRFTDKFGNMAQKGQSASPGGQWKIQMPGGIPSCLFKGSAGQVATGAVTPMDDGEWHTLTCSLTPSGVTMYVDGVYRSTKAGTVGTIDNNIPMTVGGKINCDQIEVTCDYFSGQIDYVKITKGPNQAPNAAMTTNCPSLSCTFNGTDSSDPDGNIASYAWVFGDGTTGTGPTPHHIYAESGTYRVKLTVTDNRGATNAVVRDITVEGVPVESNVAYVGSNISVGATGTPSVAIPANAAVGDRLLLALTINATTTTFTDPAGVTGWTKLDTNVAKTMSTTFWTKEVAPGDAGAQVSVPLTGANVKYNLTAAAYSGVASTPTLAFGHAVDIVNNTVRTTPTVGAEDGSWVVSYWADKSSSTTAWTTSQATSRIAGCAPSSGRICSLLADSNAKVPAVYGNIAASTDAVSSAATMWSIVLPTSGGTPPGNQAPHADFGSDCDDLACTFNSSASTDDGAIVERAWTFGDSATATGMAPAHTYDVTGTYDVTLTVTDDGGLTDSITKQVSVDDLPDPANIQYIASAAAVTTGNKPAVTIPASASVGDKVVLALSVNSNTVTVSDPAVVTGWTKLGTNISKTMSTTIWAKTLVAGDAGKKPTVTLGAAAKATTTAAVYSGVDPAATVTFQNATDTANTATKQAPAVDAPADSWVVSYWADKSSTTNAWTTSAATGREAVCGASSGRICSLLGDSAGPVTGTYGPIAASTDAPTTTATMWSVVLRPEV